MVISESDRSIKTTQMEDCCHKSRFLLCNCFRDFPANADIEFETLQNCKSFSVLHLWKKNTYTCIYWWNELSPAACCSSDGPMTREGADSRQCPPSLLGQSGMSVCAASSTRVCWSTTISAWCDEECNTLSKWVCVCVYVCTYKGHRDYGSRAWRPEASLKITAANQVNQHCLQRLQQRDDCAHLLPLRSAISLPTDHKSWALDHLCCGPTFCTAWLRQSSPC